MQRNLIIGLVLAAVLAAAWFLTRQPSQEEIRLMPPGDAPPPATAGGVGSATTQSVAYGDDGQTLDLYLPGQKNGPLLIFVPGGFWGEHSAGFLLPEAVIQSLQQHGVTVAQVRHRPASQARHPAQVQDVAQAVAWLLRQAQHYSYNKDRIYLAGHSSGAHLAALLVQDPRYLAAHQLNSRTMAGVILMGAALDVRQEVVVSPKQDEMYSAAFGRDASVRQQASPLNYARADTPPILVLSAEADLPGYSDAARRFMLRQREAGHTQVYHHVISHATHLSMVQMQDESHATLRYLLAFMQLDPGTEFFSTRLAARWQWHDPPLSTEAFWKGPQQVKSYPVDQRFANALVRLLQGNAYMATAYPLQQFHAIDLEAYVRSLDPAKLGKGDFVELTNLRGEKLYYSLEKLRPYKPVMVVGLDDEKNLFRLAVFYETRRQYSWQEDTEPQPLLVRPLGAFLYFLEPPPEELEPKYLAQYSHTADGFRLLEKDPLAWVWQLPPVLQPVFNQDNGCVSCHAFHGMTARAHHNRASDLQAQGGFAIPLTSYPPDTWKRFVFHQEQAAEVIGVMPNVISEAAQQPLYEMVEEARKGQ